MALTSNFAAERFPSVSLTTSTVESDTSPKPPAIATTCQEGGFALDWIQPRLSDRTCNCYMLTVVFLHKNRHLWVVNVFGPKPSGEVALDLLRRFAGHRDFTDEG